MNRVYWQSYAMRISNSIQDKLATLYNTYKQLHKKCISISVQYKQIALYKVYYNYHTIRTWKFL